MDIAPPDVSPETWLGDRLRTLREQREWNQRYVAGRMRSLGYSGWNQAVVSRIEDGARVVSLSEASDLAGLFGLRLSSLLDGIPERPACSSCANMPPAGFTCDACERRGVADDYAAGVTVRKTPTSPYYFDVCGVTLSERMAKHLLCELLPARERDSHESHKGNFVTTRVALTKRGLLNDSGPFGYPPPRGAHGWLTEKGVQVARVLTQEHPGLVPGAKVAS